MKSPGRAYEQKFIFGPRFQTPIVRCAKYDRMAYGSRGVVDMVVGVCTIELELPMVASLKEKRQIVQSIMRRIRNEFNVSIGEVDAQDSWQMAVLAASCISTDSAYAHGLLTKLVKRIEALRMDIVLLDYQIEML